MNKQQKMKNIDHRLYCFDNPAFDPIECCCCGSGYRFHDGDEDDEDYKENGFWEPLCKCHEEDGHSPSCVYFANSSSSEWNDFDD